MTVRIVDADELVHRSFSLSCDFLDINQTYYCFSRSHKFLYWSSSLELLIDFLTNINQPPDLSLSSFSLLCQSSFLPRPLTPYKNIFTIPRGSSVTFVVRQGLFHSPSNNSLLPKPFKSNSFSNSEIIPTYSDLLEKIFCSIQNQFDSSKSGYLFHSAGKDSNSIALALAEAGWQHKVTLICHKSDANFDESEISRTLASKLGFDHIVLSSPGNFSSHDQALLKSFISSATLPSLDAVYPFYVSYLNQIPELYHSNIIDGGGNDFYMGLPASRKDTFLLAMSRFFSNLRQLPIYFPSGGYLSSLLKTPAECCGITGLSFPDVSKLLSLKYNSNQDTNSYFFWSQFTSLLGSDISPHDFKSFIVGQIADEMHIKKIKNFSSAISANLILPWADQDVAKYVLSWPDEYIIDRSRGNNKPFLRSMLLDMLGLDSYKLGKLGYSVDTFGFVRDNWLWIYDTIVNTSIWNDYAICSVCAHLKERMLSEVRYSNLSATLLLRLLLVSLWVDDRELF